MADARVNFQQPASVNMNGHFEPSLSVLNMGNFLHMSLRSVLLIALETWAYWVSLCLWGHTLKQLNCWGCIGKYLLHAPSANLTSSHYSKLKYI